MPGICALRSVRSTWRLGDILSAAIAFVQQSAVRQLRDRCVVPAECWVCHSAGLVPGEPDGGEVVELAVGDVGEGAVVEIIDADQESAAGRAGEQPRQHGGAQIADVQVGRRAGANLPAVTPQSN